jgi:hypothetical protein
VNDTVPMRDLDRFRRFNPATDGVCNRNGAFCERITS